MPTGTFTYGTSTVDFANIPENVLLAGFVRYAKHALGNEIASNVSAKQKIQTEAGTPLSEQELTELTNDMRTAKIQSWYAGELTAGRSNAPRGPKLSELEVAMADMAEMEVCNMLVQHKRLVKDARTGAYSLAEGGKLTGKTKLATIGSEEFTLPELVARRLAKESERTRIEAFCKKELARKAQALSQVAEGEF